MFTEIDSESIYKAKQTNFSLTLVLYVGLLALCWGKIEKSVRLSLYVGSWGEELEENSGRGKQGKRRRIWYDFSCFSLNQHTPLNQTCNLLKDLIRLSDYFPIRRCYRVIDTHIDPVIAQCISQVAILKKQANILILFIMLLRIVSQMKEICKKCL